MAILENVSTEAGDVLRIKTEAPIVGLISLTQFIDTTVGESETDYFRKEFRYSVDAGLTFFEWTQLTLINIAAVAITKYDAFVIEYRYIRVGNTPAVNLTFNDILVSGTIEDLPYPIFKSVVFNKFFNVNDLNVFGWALNVLEKLYQKGLILPNYLDRADNQSNLEDEDFITFWLSITHFFAILVYFARQFHDFESHQLLLEQFLKSKDLTLPSDSNFADLKYLYDNHIAEYSKRGTNKIYEASDVTIDGELLRLLGHQSYEEFIFCFFQNYENGWCLGKSSPTWKGTENIINLIKGYEYSNIVNSLLNYPLLESSYISLVSNKIQINGVLNGIFSGIGGTTKKIAVDPSQDYEISFRVSQSIKEPNLKFGCRVWDKNGNERILTNVITVTNSNYFFEGGELGVINTDYWVRGVLFGNTTTLPLNSKTTLAIGNNLRLPADAASIVPIIGVYGSGSVCLVKIDSIKIRPRKLNFSRGQLGIHNLIYLLSVNNNGSLTQEKIKNFIEQKLISYNSFLKLNLI